MICKFIEILVYVLVFSNKILKIGMGIGFFFFLFKWELDNLFGLDFDICYRIC